MGEPYLEEVNRYPLMPPKVDRATEMGITQENIPSSFSPKVCNSKTGRCLSSSRRACASANAAAHHGYGVGAQQLLRAHGGEVGDVGQGVDERHQWDGNVDGPGKVPAGGTRRFLNATQTESLGWTRHLLARLHHLLRHVVEEVPAAVGKRGLKEGQRHLSHRWFLEELEGHAGLQGLIVTWRKREGVRPRTTLAVSCPSNGPHWSHFVLSVTAD